MQQQQNKTKVKKVKFPEVHFISLPLSVSFQHTQMSNLKMHCSSICPSSLYNQLHFTQGCNSNEERNESETTVKAGILIWRRRMGMKKRLFLNDFSKSASNFSASYVRTMEKHILGRGQVFPYEFWVHWVQPTTGSHKVDPVKTILCDYYPLVATTAHYQGWTGRVMHSTQCTINQEGG